MRNYKEASSNSFDNECSIIWIRITRIIQLTIRVMQIITINKMGHPPFKCWNGLDAKCIKGN